MNTSNILVFVLTGCLLGSAAFAAGPSSEPEDAEAAEEVPSVIEETRDLSAPPEFFLGTRDLLTSLAASRGKGRGPTDPERAQQHLDLAEAYFEQGLVLEAWSFLDGIPEGALSPDLAQRHQQLVAMVTVFDPRPGAMPDLPETAFSDVPQEEVYQALAHARAGRAGEAAAMLAPHVDDLSMLPDSLQLRALPHLLLATIDANDWETSRALVIAFQSRAELSDSSAFSYLLGHTALEHGEKLRAFDHFAMASGGADIWGHRARLRMVDLAVAHGGITAEEQEQMLSRIYGAWRRGPEATVTLLRIEDVQRGAENRLGALETLSTLMTNHAGSPEADAAQARAREILNAHYGRLIHDGADLNSVIEEHERIAKDYRFFEGFDVFAELFGDHLLSVGITGRSAQEYRLTGEYLVAAASLDLFETPPIRFDALRLKEARALLAGGQLERAKGLLEQPLNVDDPHAAARLASLRAEYFARAGEAISDAEDTGQAHPSSYIRELAQRYFDAEEWERAKLEYLRLANVLGADLETPDAVNLYLAAERSGDAALSKVMGELLAEREDLERATSNAAPGVEDMADPTLRRDALQATVERTVRVLSEVDALTAPQADDADAAQE